MMHRDLAMAAAVILAFAPACSGEGGGEDAGDAGDSPEDPRRDETAGETDGDAAPPEGEGGELDDAEAVSVSIPSELACRAAATASIEMRNTGTTTWTRAAGYKLGAVDDADPLYGPDTRVWLPEGVEVAPGSTTTFTFELRAPAEEAVYTTDWQMVREGVRWFGAQVSRDVAVTCTAPPARTGIVRLSGNSLIDDQGTFNALGATMMWAAWGYRHDREKLERNLDVLARSGFDYIRALGSVGNVEAPDYWDGREIDPGWPDYAEVIAGTTDLAYDGYGLRVEWTLMGSADSNEPDEADRYALVDAFLAMAAGREQKIIHFEIANESWQNGFPGDEGVAQLRALSSYMRDRTEILVAASAPDGHDCAAIERVYAGGIADLATIHFDREITLVDGPWRPVRQPWELEYCADVPVGSNNEPIGPGSSVYPEEDPVRLVAAAITTYVSNLPLYVFHSNAGVRGDEEIGDMPGVGSFVHVKDIVPPDLASWTRQNAHWADAPFVVFAYDASGTALPDTMWPDLESPTGGAVRAYGDVSGEVFFVFPIGILDRVGLEPRRDMEFDIINPMTGTVLEHRVMSAGERFDLAGAEALVLKGSFL